MTSVLQLHFTDCRDNKKKNQTYPLHLTRTQACTSEDNPESFRHRIYSPCKNCQSRQPLPTSTYTSTFGPIRPKSGMGRHYEIQQKFCADQRSSVVR